MNKQFDPPEIKILEYIFKARKNKKNQVKEHLIVEDLEKAGFKEPQTTARLAFLKLEEKGYINEELHSERSYLLTETAEKLFDSAKVRNTKEQPQDEKVEYASYPLRVPAPLYKQVRIKLANEEKKLREILIDALIVVVQT
ncbi:MAG: hypothetical protein QM652_11595 [Legionella sp.]|uniref:hypothetical protein n=1 Tax=Legionella sp. TaxID=459 RepID=UPI0039E6F3B4